MLLKDTEMSPILLREDQFSVSILLEYANDKLYLEGDPLWEREDVTKISVYLPEELSINTISVDMLLPKGKPPNKRSKSCRYIISKKIYFQIILIDFWLTSLLKIEK